jgi:chitosanase
MLQLLVTANKLNKRNRIPLNLPDANGISGTVLKGYRFAGEEVSQVPNPSLGKWYKDRDHNFYWGGALVIEDQQDDEGDQDELKGLLEKTAITGLVKKKIEQVVNAFETGSAEGDYAELVKYRDYTDPMTKEKKVQVTFGRSQTTEFGHLKALVQDYVNSKGTYTSQLAPYLNRLGKQPTLATDTEFCTALKNAGKSDPIMRKCQDDLFEAKYYQPAYHWFTANGFTLPLSMLVIYDSTIHSGGILSFLRKRFPTVLPVSGGDEKEWITNYVNVRNEWLATNNSDLLKATVYRTKCFKTAIENNNWDIAQPISANDVLIS